MTVQCRDGVLPRWMSAVDDGGGIWREKCVLSNCIGLKSRDWESEWNN